MTFNEINNQETGAPLFWLLLVSAWCIPSMRIQKETMYQVLHHQFVASATAVEAARRINHR